MSEHRFKIGDKVKCIKDTNYYAHEGSIYTIDAFYYPNDIDHSNQHFKFKEIGPYWHPAENFIPYVEKQFNPRALFFLKEYKDKGHITRAEWLELKAIVEEMEK